MTNSNEGNLSTLTGLALVFCTTALLMAQDMPSVRTFTNSCGMSLIRVDAGRFVMGSDTGQWDERPTHEVVISQAFYLGVTEVTNAQYEQLTVWGQGGPGGHWPPS